MNIFCFPSESINHVLAAHAARQWAVSSCDITENFKKQLITKMLDAKCGDLGFLYCKEDKKFHLPFTITSLPSPVAEYSQIWNSEWIGRFSFVPWLFSPDKGLPIDRVVEVMPTIKEQTVVRPKTESGRPTAWSNYLRVSVQEAFNPQQYVTFDDFARMVRYLQLELAGMPPLA